MVAPIQDEGCGRGPLAAARVCLLAQLREQNRRRFEPLRGQNWTPHQPHVTTRGTRVERPMRATAASLAAAASGDGGSACVNRAKAAAWGSRARRNAAPAGPV
jgi:hypothetical protein